MNLSELPKSQVREKLQADTAEYLKENQIELIAAQPTPCPFKTKRAKPADNPREQFYRSYVNNLCKEHQEFIGVPQIKRV